MKKRKSHENQESATTQKKIEALYHKGYGYLFFFKDLNTKPHGVSIHISPKDISKPLVVDKISPLRGLMATFSSIAESDGEFKGMLREVS